MSGRTLLDCKTLLTEIGSVATSFPFVRVCITRIFSLSSSFGFEILGFLCLGREDFLDGEEGIRSEDERFKFELEGSGV